MKIREYARVVVDGVDGAGKSTLVKQILDYLGDQAYFVPGYNRTPAENRLPMPSWWMGQLAYNPSTKVVVHDRFFYSELVYGPILRNTLVGEESTRSYVQEFLRHRAFLVYCRPPVPTLIKSAKVEPQMEGVHENFIQLVSGYDQVMFDEAKHMYGRFFKYDWTEDTALMELLNKLAGYIYE